MTYCKVIPFTVKYFAAPILNIPYKKNYVKDWANLVKHYPQLKILNPDIK